MATKDLKTRWQLEFEGKNAEALQKTVEKLADSLSPEKLSGGFQKMEHWMKQNERQLRGMETHFKALNQSLHKFTQNVEKINEMADGLKKVKQEAKGAGEEARKAGRFIQGLVQGLGVGEYMPSGPGMGRQVAGRMAGGAARRAGGLARGIATSPFTGISGLSQGLSGIPVVGGMMAGQLQAAQATSQQFVGHQRTQMQLAPFLNVSGAAAAGQAAADAAGRGAGGRVAGRGMAAGEAAILAAQTAATRKPGTANEARRSAERNRTHLKNAQAAAAGYEARGEAVPERITKRIAMRQKMLGSTGEMSEAELQGLGSAAGKAEMIKATKEEARAVSSARASGRSGALGLSALRASGLSLGAMSATQANQFAGQVLGAGGGTLDEAQRGGGIRGAMAAQTAFGVGGATSGAFIRGARRGGITGAGGGAGIADAIEAGMKSGMDKTEVRDFLQQIAAAQQEFVRTGIPINPTSVARMGGVFASAGLGVARGGALSQGLRGAAGRVSQKGPQTAAEFLILQQLGGFQGGGLQELEKAQLQLENMQGGQFGEEGILGLVRTISQGAGGGVAGRFSLRNAFQGLGMDIGVEETQFLQSAAGGGSLSVDQQERLAKIQKGIAGAGAGAPSGLSGLEAQAQQVIRTLGGAVQAQASLENRRLAVGAKLVTAMQNLERVTLAGQTAFATFGAELTAATAGLNNFAQQIPAAAKVLRAATVGDEPLQSTPEGG